MVIKGIFSHKSARNRAEKNKKKKKKDKVKDEGVKKLLSSHKNNVQDPDGTGVKES